VENRLDKFGLNKPTPMGWLLECFGQDRHFKFFGEDIAFNQ
jgi:hypothetical protein